MLHKNVLEQTAQSAAGKAGAGSRLLPDQAFKVQEDSTTERAGNTAGLELGRSHGEVGNIWGSFGEERGEDQLHTCTRIKLSK